MLNQFTIIKNILWLGLACSITLSILQDFALPTILFVTIILIALTVLLVSNRTELVKKVQKLEVTTSLPSKYDEFIYGKYKPRFRDIAPWVALLGLFSYYFAYLAAHGAEPTRIARIVYQFFGVPGVVLFWSIIGTVTLAGGIEAWLGSRQVKNEQA